MDQLSNPAFSTSIGLLLWGAHHIGTRADCLHHGSPLGGGLSRVTDWLRGLFPADLVASD